MVRFSKCPLVTVFGDVKVFYAKAGEIGDRDCSSIDSDRSFAVFADFDGAASLIHGVLQFTQLLTLAARVHEQERRNTKNVRIQLLLAGGVRPDRGDVRAGLEIGGAQQGKARSSRGDDQTRRKRDSRGRIGDQDFGMRQGSLKMAATLPSA